VVATNQALLNMFTVDYKSSTCHLNYNPHSTVAALPSPPTKCFNAAAVDVFGLSDSWIFLVTAILEEIFPNGVWESGVSLACKVVLFFLTSPEQMCFYPRLLILPPAFDL